MGKERKKEISNLGGKGGRMKRMIMGGGEEGWDEYIQNILHEILKG